MVHILEDLPTQGESLFNDGTAVVLFKMILLISITGTELSVGGSIFDFVRVVFIGAMVGLCVGAIGSRVTRYFDDHLLEITCRVVGLAKIKNSFHLAHFSEKLGFLSFIFEMAFVGI